MTKKKDIENTQGENIEAVENALSKTEQFIENNQKLLLGILAVILVVVGGYVLYEKFYKQPLNEEALTQMFMAEKYFERDSFKLALEGDINYPGFLGIIEDYGMTKSGNLSNYYAGVCYMNLGDYDAAIDHLNSFSTNDPMLDPISKGLIGDAYREKGELNDAIKYYKRAIESHLNDFITPLYLYKLGRTLEENEQNEDALKTYERILKEYPRSNEGRTIEKNIAAVKVKLGQL